MEYNYVDDYIYDVRVLLPAAYSTRYAMCSGYHDPMDKCGYLQRQAVHVLLE